MKTLPSPSSSLPNQESVLVAASIAGDRASFGQLVSLHQAAVSGVAYSICGDFAASEDLAQEAFVAAWKQLPALQEPARFRAWVCGIARLLALNYVRTRARHSLDNVADAGSENLSLDEPSPRESATSEEEKALLWRTLAKLPENYREPLVLFYREQQSIAQVAAALELSEDVVKQRLSRGRILLRDELSGVLETALFRTRPGSAFTAAVLGALPPALAATGVALAAGTAKAASAGAATTSTSGTAAAAASVSVSFLGSFASAVVGLLGFYVLYQAWRGARIDPAIRRLLLFTSTLSVLTAGLFAAAFVAIVRNPSVATAAGLSTATALTVLALGYVLVQSLVAVFAFMRLQTLLRTARLARQPAPFAWPATFPARRYESRIRFLGMPLVAIAQGPDASRGENLGIARGWIAIGDVALGGLVGSGAVALAPISIAGLGIGVFSLSGLAFGALAFGGCSVGFLSCGGLAFGWEMAVGGAAFARDIALGGIAVAHDTALGGLAFASQANTAAAWQSVQTHPLHGPVFRWLPYASLLSLLAVPSLIIALGRIHPRAFSTRRD